MKPGISHVARHLRGRFGLFQVSECPDSGNGREGLVQDFSKPGVRLGDTDPRGGDTDPRGGFRVRLQASLISSVHKPAMERVVVSFQSVVNLRDLRCEGSMRGFFGPFRKC